MYYRENEMLHEIMLKLPFPHDGKGQAWIADWLREMITRVNVSSPRLQKMSKVLEMCHLMSQSFVKYCNAFN